MAIAFVSFAKIFLNRSAIATAVLATHLLLALLTAYPNERPNIVVIVADDLGYGELQCLNPKRGLIKTPQLDSIAASGMVFTDAHSGSSVCTPTRYGLMTGRYAWRTRLQRGVMTGGESLIAADRSTLAKLLRAEGYLTAAIGKWHLGMLFDGKHAEKEVPIGARVTHGPLDRGGFDEFHGFHHARQIETWVKNDRVTETIKPVAMLPRLTEEAIQYIRRRQGNDQPFFLYVAWSSPHSPVVPSDRWKGKSELNSHADFVMQTDDSFGQVVEALRQTGKLNNTLLVCTSDNGTSAPTSRLAELQKLGHFPSGDLRGSKADIWDGGHRVPFLVLWPGIVAAGTRSDELVCLTDLMATIAELVGRPLPENAAEDSFSFLPTLQGKPDHARQDLIHHSIAGYFAIRQGNWKLCVCPDSGGWTEPKPSAKNWAELERSGQPLRQLYDMSADIGEQSNHAKEQPQIVERLTELLQVQVAQGRSTPGAPLSNDVEITIQKHPSSE